MKNINFSKIALFLGLIVGAFIICVICFLWFDNKAYCLDMGKIYDPIQKICRDDCLTWDNKTGCVPKTEENVEKTK